MSEDWSSVLLGGLCEHQIYSWSSIAWVTTNVVLLMIWRKIYALGEAKSMSHLPRPLLRVSFHAALEACHLSRRTGGPEEQHYLRQGLRYEWPYYVFQCTFTFQKSSFDFSPKCPLVRSRLVFWPTINSKVSICPVNRVGKRSIFISACDLRGLCKMTSTHIRSHHSSLLLKVIDEADAWDIYPQWYLVINWGISCLPCTRSTTSRLRQIRQPA